MYSKDVYIDMIDYSLERYGLLYNHGWHRIIHDKDDISGFINYKQAKELYNLVKYYMDKYGFKYGEISLSMKYGYCGEPEYINFIIPDCDWKAWGDMDNDMSDHINYLKGKIAIVCIKGLVE